MILKLIGAILTVVSSTAIGFYFSSSLNDRIQDMKELKKGVLILKGDIRYGNTPLPEAVQSLAQRSASHFKSFYMELAEMLNNFGGTTFEEIWKKSIRIHLNKTALLQKDKELFEKLGESLGYLDKEMQMDTIDLYLEQLEQEIAEALNVRKEKAHLYNSLGVMAGIFLTIVLL